MTRFTLLGIALAAILFASPFLTATHADQLFDGRGIPIDVTVTKITNTTITYDEKGVEKTIDVKDLRKLNFDDDPKELRDARQSVLEGNYNEAAGHLAKINVEGLRSPEVKEDALFYKALCNAKMALRGEAGSVADSSKELHAFVTNEQYARGFHYFEAIELLGDVLMARAATDSNPASQYQNAETYFQTLFDKVPWPEHKMRAMLKVSESQIAQEKYAEALAKYQTIESSSLNSPEANRMKLYATVGKAVCLAATGKHDEGVQLIQDIIRRGDASDSVLFGRAYNALGTCYLKQGKSKDALMAFLHVDVLFNAEPDAHAEALYHLKKLWDEMKKPERRNRAEGLLTSQYGGTRWAKLP